MHCGKWRKPLTYFSTWSWPQPFWSTFGLKCWLFSDSDCKSPNFLCPFIFPWHKWCWVTIVWCYMLHKRLADILKANQVSLPWNKLKVIYFYVPLNDIYTPMRIICWHVWLQEIMEHICCSGILSSFYVLFKSFLDLTETV